MKRWLVAAALVAVPSVAEASTVQEFITKANALKAKGIMAVGSADLAAMRGEMAGITAAYRADLAAAKTAGKPPHSCPPAKGRLGAGEFMAELNAIPPAKRGMSMKAAFYGIMKKRYPCKG